MTFMIELSPLLLLGQSWVLQGKGRWCLSPVVGWSLMACVSLPSPLVLSFTPRSPRSPIVVGRAPGRLARAYGSSRARSEPCPGEGR